MTDTMVRCNTGKDCACHHAPDHTAWANCDEWNYCRRVEQSVRCTDGKEVEK